MGANSFAWGRDSADESAPTNDNKKKAPLEIGRNDDHGQKFLLKFAGDRRRWLQRLFEAGKRYGLSVLNYIATSNHIHFLVRDNGERDVIPKSSQLIAGRTGQEFNQRKNRKGAYWEDTA